MLLFGNKFVKCFKKALKAKNFEVQETELDDQYIVSNGCITLNVDTTEARIDFEQNKSSQKLTELISSVEHEYSVKYSLVTFHNAQQYLRLLLIPEDKVKPSYVSLDFIDGIKKVIALSYENDSIYPLENAIIKKWNTPADVLFAVADRNMCNILAQSEMHLSEVAGGIHVLEFPGSNDSIRAALMLCSTFRKTVSEKLGNKFLVVAPSSRSLMAVENVTNNIIEAFGPVVIGEYTKAKHPIFTDVLLFTQNDITVAGRFRADIQNQTNGDETNEKEKAHT